MIRIESSGSFAKTDSFFKRILRDEIKVKLDKYGKKGVSALKEHTPKDGGETRNGWYYTVKKTNRGYSLSWHNKNVNDGVVIALIIQLGHATRSGTWVDGVDYINPALKPIFEDIANSIWKEVKSG
jgi:hypothetical protein